jgi:hypothetical protein
VGSMWSEICQIKAKNVGYKLIYKKSRVAKFVDMKMGRERNLLGFFILKI